MRCTAAITVRSSIAYLVLIAVSAHGFESRNGGFGGGRHSPWESEKQRTTQHQRGRDYTPVYSVSKMCLLYSLVVVGNEVVRNKVGTMQGMLDVESITRNGP